MTNDKALDIIKNFADHDAEDILTAVQFLENANNTATIPALSAFYGDYLDEWSWEDQYQDYEVTKQILAHNDLALEQFNQDASNLASDFAEIVGDENKDMSLIQHRIAKTVFDDFPQSTDAENKLNERITKLIEELIKDINNFDMSGYADLKWLVDRLPDGLLKDDATKFLASAKQKFEDENGLNLDKETLAKKDRDIDRNLQDIQLYDSENRITPDFESIKPLINNIEIRDNNENILSDSEKQKRIQQLFEAAKLEAYKEKIGDSDYLIKSRKTRQQLLSDSTMKHFQAKIAIAALATDYELARPTMEEQNDPAKFAQFLETRSDAVTQKLTKIFNQTKVTLSDKSVITACADTKINLFTFKNRLNEKLGQNSKFGQRLNKFKSGCVALWGKQYEITEKVIKNIKENRAQHIGNAIATGGMLLVGAFASEYILAASIAYGAYSAAGAAVYPIVAEASRLREDAKNKNQKMSVWNSWKQAFAKLKNDKSYKDGIKWATGGAVLGAVTGGILSGTGASTAISKLGVTLGRTFASTTAQTTKLITAKRNFKRNPSEANSDALRSARISAGIGITVAGLVTWLGVNNAAAQNAAENAADTLTGGGNGGGVPPIDGSEASLPTPQPDTTQANQGLLGRIKGLFNRDTTSRMEGLTGGANGDSIPPADTTQTDSVANKSGFWRRLFSRDTTSRKSSFNPENYRIENDSSGLVSPADSSQLASPADSSQLASQADSLGVKTDSLDTGNEVGGGKAPATNVSVTETDTPTTPQPGDVISTKDYGNGITKTVTMGENGVKQVSYTGLSGGIETSENVENFYKTSLLPENCEEKFADQLKILQKQDSNIKSITQVIENIKAQYELGNFELPEGMSLEHAIHTSFMRALYHGDTSAISAMNCPNGEDTATMFTKLAFMYSTNDGVIIGYPVGETHQDKIGSITIKPGCEPQVYEPKPTIETPAPEPEVPVAPKPILQPAPIWAPEGGGKGVQFPSAYSTNAHNPSGTSVSLIDGNSDGQFTAREVHGGNGQRGFRLDGDDRIRVTATATDTNGRTYEATQEQRIFNVAEGDLYHGSPESSVTRIAEALGGKPEEIISVKDKAGNITNYVYLTKDGIEVSYDPNNNYQPRIRALNGGGIPQEYQNRAFHRSQALMQNVFQANNVEANTEQTPKSSLIEVAIRKGKKLVDTIFVAGNTKTR